MTNVVEFSGSVSGSEIKLEKMGEPSSTYLLRVTDDLCYLRVPPFFCSSFELSSYFLCKLSLFFYRKLFLGYIAILNELKTRYILLQLRKIEFLVSSKELEQPFDNWKRFAQMPEFSQKVLCL